MLRSAAFCSAWLRPTQVINFLAEVQTKLKGAGAKRGAGGGGGAGAAKGSGAGSPGSASHALHAPQQHRSPSDNGEKATASTSGHTRGNTATQSHRGGSVGPAVNIPSGGTMGSYRLVDVDLSSYLPNMRKNSVAPSPPGATGAQGTTPAQAEALRLWETRGLSSRGGESGSRAIEKTAGGSMSNATSKRGGSTATVASSTRSISGLPAAVSMGGAGGLSAEWAQAFARQTRSMDMLKVAAQKSPASAAGGKGKEKGKVKEGKTHKKDSKSPGDSTKKKGFGAHLIDLFTRS